jgi:hypothetical protein
VLCDARHPERTCNCIGLGTVFLPPGRIFHADDMDGQILVFSSHTLVITYPAMSGLTGSTPQFGTAEYASQTGAERCRTCNQLLGNRYYRVNGVLACENCVERIKLQTPTDTHSTLVRGLLFGVGGALIGLFLYSAFGIITGLAIGYVSLAVGYIVGKAILKGTGGVGGRRYQIAAAALTYAAVSMSAIPIGISQIVKQKNEQKSAKHVAPAGSESGISSPAVSQSDANELAEESPAQAVPKWGWEQRWACSRLLD